MRKAAQVWAALAIGLTLLGSRQAWGQPPAPPRLTVVPADLPALFERLAERMRALSEDVVGTFASTADGRALGQDARELVQALADFQATLPGARDAFELRQRYAGIDASWHHLQAQLGRAGVAAPAVERDAARVSEVDAQVHKALGLNAYPRDYYTGGSAPTGAAETQRLAHALVDRAESLAAVIRADLPGPNGKRAVDAAMSLVSVADDFHDAIDLTARLDILRNGFAGVPVGSRTLAQELDAVAITPRVRDAWRAYKAVEVLIRQNLGIANEPAELAGTAIPSSGGSPVVELSNQLVTQVDAFLQVFGPTAGTVPEGGFLLADAQRLRAAAVRFRDDAVRGLGPGQLAFSFRDVDAFWQRLARRTNRIARGRTGPNIQQVGLMGQTCAQIHQLLGVPGYPPVVVVTPAPR